MDFRKKVTLNQVHQISPLYAVFIKHGPIRDNQKCLKRTLEESHMRTD